MAETLIQYPLGAAGVVTRVLEQGAGPETVVLIHGLGARADRWRLVLDRLARQGYRCLAPDLPGHGLATKGPDVPFSPPALADWVVGLLDELGLASVDLVGTSLGGHIAALVAGRVPARIRRLVLMGSLGLVPRPDIIPPMTTSVRQQSRDAIEAKLLRVFGDPELVTEAFVTEEWRIANSPGAAAALDRYAAYLDEDHPEDLATAALRDAVPKLETLLVWGAEDVSVPPEVGRAALEQLPEARLVVIEGAAHGPYLERPEAVTAVLHEFFSGTLALSRLAHR